MKLNHFRLVQATISGDRYLIAVHESMTDALRRSLYDANAFPIVWHGVFDSNFDLDVPAVVNTIRFFVPIFTEGELVAFGQDDQDNYSEFLDWESLKTRAMDW